VYIFSLIAKLLLVFELIDCATVDLFKIVIKVIRNFLYLTYDNHDISFLLCKTEIGASDVFQMYQKGISEIMISSYTALMP
jgi:hypothetical protein